MTTSLFQYCTTSNGLKAIKKPFNQQKACWCHLPRVFHLSLQVLQSDCTQEGNFCWGPEEESRRDMGNLQIFRICVFFEKKGKPQYWYQKQNATVQWLYFPVLAWSKVLSCSSMTELLTQNIRNAVSNKTTLNTKLNNIQNTTNTKQKNKKALLDSKENIPARQDSITERFFISPC